MNQDKVSLTASDMEALRPFLEGKLNGKTMMEQGAALYRVCTNAMFNILRSRYPWLENWEFTIHDNGEVVLDFQRAEDDNVRDMRG
jgi:hypothetical protein